MWNVNLREIFFCAPFCAQIRLPFYQRKNPMFNIQIAMASILLKSQVNEQVAILVNGELSQRHRCVNSKIDINSKPAVNYGEIITLNIILHRFTNKRKDFGHKDSNLMHPFISKFKLAYCVCYYLSRGINVTDSSCCLYY